MRAPPIAALALVVAAACAVGCDDATLWEPRDAGPGHPNPSGWPLGPDCGGCTREHFGPLQPDESGWVPGRVVLFSANVGSSGEYRTSRVQSLLAPRHRFYAAEGDFGPALAHSPPYDDEIYDLLDARGITASQAFDDVQFTAPQAVMMLMTLVPSGELPYRGPSFDFELGPIIPNFLFPITVHAELFRDGRLVSTDDGVHVGHDRFAPSLTVSGTDPAVDAAGVSHLFLAFAANGALGGLPPFNPPDGDYEYRVTVTDAAADGWNVRVPFKVGKGGEGAVPPMTGAGGSAGPGAGGSGGAAGVGGTPTGGGPGGGGNSIIVPLVPDANGAFDGSNAAGVRGAWWAGGDFYGLDGSAGGGSCSLAGFAPSNCSMIHSPPLGQPITPVNGAICTDGLVPQVSPGSDGQPAWSSIWGTIIGFNLAVDDAGVAGPYDARARKLSGFAFDVEPIMPPGGAWMRVEFATVRTNDGAAYWQGAVSDASPVMRPGHYEVRWGQVGGPFYLGPSAPPFDPTQLTSIRFHVIPNLFAPIPYGFCIRNTAFLMDY